MTYYLLKTEPSTYSFADLQKDKKTVWDGVTSPAAVKHMREMKAPAQLIIYHTGNQKCAETSQQNNNARRNQGEQAFCRLTSGA
jgi:predicted RNA-binding protein with PUA-like domain